MSKVPAFRSFPRLIVCRFNRNGIMKLMMQSDTFCLCLLMIGEASRLSLRSCFSKSRASQEGRKDFREKIFREKDLSAFIGGCGLRLNMRSRYRSFSFSFPFRNAWNSRDLTLPDQEITDGMLEILLKTATRNGQDNRCRNVHVYSELVNQSFF